MRVQLDWHDPLLPNHYYRWDPMTTAASAGVCTNRPLRADYLDELVWSQVIALLAELALVQTALGRRRSELRAANPGHCRAVPARDRGRPRHQHRVPRARLPEAPLRAAGRVGLRPLLVPPDPCQCTGGHCQPW